MIHLWARIYAIGRTADTCAGTWPCWGYQEPDDRCGPEGALAPSSPEILPPESSRARLTRWTGQTEEVHDLMRQALFAYALFFRYDSPHGPSKWDIPSPLPAELRVGKRESLVPGQQPPRQRAPCVDPGSAPGGERCETSQ